MLRRVVLPLTVLQKAQAAQMHAWQCRSARSALHLELQPSRAVGPQHNRAVEQAVIRSEKAAEEARQRTALRFAEALRYIKCVRP